MVVLTLLSHATQIPSTVNCFEFFGFDVLIDSSLRPWLLEVNLSPALGNDCDADRSVKKPMLHDMFDLLGLPLYNTGLSVYSEWLDDTKENHEIHEEQEINNSKKAQKYAVNAAGKWRKKQKRTSAKHHSKMCNQRKVLPSTIIDTLKVDKKLLSDVVSISGKHFPNAINCHASTHQVQQNKSVCFVIIYNIMYCFFFYLCFVNYFTVSFEVTTK